MSAADEEPEAAEESDLTPSDGQPGARFFAGCKECQWVSQGYRLKAGAQAAQRRHNESTSHVSIGATVREVDDE